MVHLSDIDWNAPGEEAIARYNKGDMVKAKVLDVDIEKERISLGIKQLQDDPISKRRLPQGPDHHRRPSSRSPPAASRWRSAKATH